MNIVRLNAITKQKLQNIMQRSAGSYRTIIPRVRSVMQKVQTDGDIVLRAKGIKRYGKTFTLQVSKEEIAQAYKEVDSAFTSALGQMIKNITAVHRAQLPQITDTVVKPEDGISVWRQWRPIEKIGLYIPGGKAIYPSSVLMSAIPAQIAGCRKIVLCSPPRGTGNIPAPTLVAADMIGITQIFKIGGAEAIAAMTYGTKTIPAVYKIFGAGNTYVTAAKMLARDSVAIDMPAGPSEIFIIADETANPKYIAADLLADGEHGEDSACILITTSEYIANQTVLEINKQLPGLVTGSRARTSIEKYGLFAVADSIGEAVKFANEYAPEHLEIMTKNAGSLVKNIVNAGSVFLGDWTCKAAGDYATGANHVLPTGGMAKMYPPLGVDCFGKWMQVQKCTKTGLRKIRNTIETVARAEQLPAHKNSASIRFTV